MRAAHRQPWSRRGASAMQYALVLGLIAALAIVAIARLGGSVERLMNVASNRMLNAGGVSSGSGAGTGAGGTGGGGPPITAGAWVPAPGGRSQYAAQSFPTSAILAGVSGGTGAKTVTAVSGGTNCTASLSGATVTLATTGPGASCGYTVTDEAGTTASAAITPAFAYPASCAALRAADPALADGNYTVRPNATDIAVYCDLDLTVNGVSGWTLIISPSAGATMPSAAGAGVRVTLGSHLYMPLAGVQDIVTASSTILLQQRGAATPWVISTTSLPANRIDAGLMTNNGASGSGAVNWAMSSGVSMDWSCSVDAATGYPNIHWSCGNGTGVHLVAAQGYNWWRWDPGAGVTEIDVWVH